MIKYFLFFLMSVSFLNSADIEVNEYKYFANGFNNVIQINKDDDIVEVRVFFKDSRNPKYQIYTKMTCTNNSCYAKLPLTKPGLLSLDYTILYKYDDGDVDPSDEYTIIKKEMLVLPRVQSRYRKEKVDVYSEYQVPAKNIKGFGSDLKILPTAKKDIWGVDIAFYTYYTINNAPKEKVLVCEECNYDNNSSDKDTIKIKKDYLKYGAGALLLFLII